MPATCRLIWMAKKSSCPAHFRWESSPAPEYETTYFNLPDGCRLTFVSDGVVEAQNQKGELFGFERSRALAMQPASVIADSARRFGQQDDITVVIVQSGSVVAETELACVPELQNPMEISATSN